MCGGNKMFRCAFAAVVFVNLQFLHAVQHDAVASTVTVRLLKLEQDVLSLKQISTAQEQKYAALLSNILTKLSSNSGDVINLKTELNTLKDQHNSTVIELNTVRGELSNTLGDLGQLQTQHQACMAGLDDLKLQLNQTKDDIDNTDIRLLRLQEKYNATVQDLQSVKSQTNTASLARLTSDVNHISNIMLPKFTTELSQIMANVSVAKALLYTTSSDVVKNTASIRNVESLTRTLNTGVQKLKLDVSHSKITVELTANKVNALNARLSRVESGSHTSSTRITTLQTALTKANQQLTSHGKALTTNSARIDTLNANTRLSQPNIFFSCSLRQQHSFHGSRSNTLKFDHIETNIGLGYNAVTAHFVAPVTGTYIFYVDYTIKKSNLGDMNIDIVKAQQVLASGFAESMNTQLKSNHASVSAVTHLIKGQQVWFSVRQDSNSVILGGDVSRYGGALLYVG